MRSSKAKSVLAQSTAVGLGDTRGGVPFRGLRGLRGRRGFSLGIGV